MASSEKSNRKMAQSLERYYIFTKLVIPSFIMCLVVLAVDSGFWLYDSFALKGKGIPNEIMAMLWVIGILLALFGYFCLGTAFHLRSPAWQSFAVSDYDGGEDTSHNPEPPQGPDVSEAEAGQAMGEAARIRAAGHIAGADSAAAAAGGIAAAGAIGALMAQYRRRILRVAWRHHIAISRRKARIAQATIIIIPLLTALALGIRIVTR